MNIEDLGWWFAILLATTLLFQYFMGRQRNRNRRKKKAKMLLLANQRIMEHMSPEERAYHKSLEDYEYNRPLPLAKKELPVTPPTTPDNGTTSDYRSRTPNSGNYGNYGGNSTYATGYYSYEDVIESDSNTRMITKAIQRCWRNDVPQFARERCLEEGVTKNEVIKFIEEETGIPKKVVEIVVNHECDIITEAIALQEAQPSAIAE